MSLSLRVSIFVNLLLGTALVLAWQWAASAWQAPAAALPDPASLEPVVLDRPAAQREASLAMLERPLFDPDRRRAATVPEADSPRPESDAAGAADPLAAAQLLGLARIPHGGVAIVRIDGVARQVRLGGRIGPWTLTDLSGLTARFTDDDGRQRELLLQRARQPALAAPSVAGSPAPEDPAQPTVTSQRPEPADEAAAVTEDVPIERKSFEQRVAERRAMREAMQQRLGQ